VTVGASLFKELLTLAFGQLLRHCHRQGSEGKSEDKPDRGSEHAAHYCRNETNGLLYISNSPRTPGANQSARVDLSEPDAVDAASLIRMLRLDSKGNPPKPLVDLVLRK
jgi:hypothetical protein